MPLGVKTRAPPLEAPRGMKVPLKPPAPPRNGAPPGLKIEFGPLAIGGPLNLF